MTYNPKQPKYYKSLKQLRDYDIMTGLGIVILAFGFIVGLFLN